MQIKLLDNEFAINNEDELLNFFKKIDVLYQEDIIVCSMIVDENEIYDDFYTKLKDGLKSIESVEVISQNKIELLDEMMATMKHYITSNISEIEKTIDGFYKASVEEKTWNNMIQIIEAITWMNNVRLNINGIAKYNETKEYLDELYSKNDELNEINQAIEDGDTVLVGDIFKYEILPVLESMNKNYMKGN